MTEVRGNSNVRGLNVRRTKFFLNTRGLTPGETRMLSEIYSWLPTGRDNGQLCLTFSPFAPDFSPGLSDPKIIPDFSPIFSINVALYQCCCVICQYNILERLNPYSPQFHAIRQNVGPLRLGHEKPVQQVEPGGSIEPFYPYDRAFEVQRHLYRLHQWQQ